MKKLVVLILTFAYLATSTGATTHLHYCMGKLIEQSTNESTADQCSNCGMEKPAQEDGCCKHETKQVKTDQVHKVQDMTIRLLQLSVALPASFIDIPAIGFASVTEENPTSNAPPLLANIPIYLRNCVFLI